MNMVEVKFENRLARNDTKETFYLGNILSRSVFIFDNNIDVDEKRLIIEVLYYKHDDEEYYKGVGLHDKYKVIPLNWIISVTELTDTPPLKKNQLPDGLYYDRDVTKEWV